MSVEVPVSANQPTNKLQVPARFQLKGELGRGGMAVVFHAYDSAGERDVALKFLPPTDDENNRRRFQREAVDLAAVFHPNIVDFYSLGESSGQEFIEMEYVAGGTLGKFQRDCDSLKTLLIVYAKICEALAHIHENGLVHRDIKPANILMTLEGEPKISDLGLARREEGRTQLTQEGTLLGTASYLAPEQLMSAAVGPAADIYALGVCLFEAACCQPPFKAATPLAMVRAHVQDPPPRPSDLMPGLPAQLDTLILSMLEKSPEGRPSDLNKVALQLREIAVGLSPEQDSLVASSNEALLGRARQYRLSGDGERAKSLLDQLEDNADPEFQLQARCERLRLQLLEKDPGVLAYAKETLQRCRERNDIKALGAALVLCGRAAFEAREWELAAQLLQEARDLVPSNNYDLQLELLGALADLHEEGSRAGVASFSEEKSRRFREIASGLLRRQESSSALLTKSSPSKVVPAVLESPGNPVSQAQAPAPFPPKPKAEKASLKPLWIGMIVLLLGVSGTAMYWFLNRPARLEVASNPPGATVMVNEERFQAPYQGELKAGDYKVKVFLQGYKPWEQDISLKSGGSMQIVASLQAASGNLNLSSKPDGAKVFVDGQARGTTPANLTGLPIKPYKIKLVKEGYKPHEETVEVHGGKTRNLQFALNKIPPPPPVYTPSYSGYSSGASSGGTYRSSGSNYKAPSQPSSQGRSRSRTVSVPKVNVRPPKVRVRF